MPSRPHLPGPTPRVLTRLAPWFCALGVTIAQDIEPRRWTHMPVGTNILGVGYVYTVGDLHFDPALRIENADVSMHTVLVSYNRYFGLFEKTARLDVQVPWQDGYWDGLLNGAPASTDRDGFGDPRVRLSVNLAGAPALEGKEFRDYVQANESNTTIGAAVAVRLPLGEYYEDRLINLGQNRYSFEAQFGALHTTGAWSWELTGSAFFFTENDEFYGGNTLEQDPLYAVQAHVIRSFDAGFWLSAGAAYGLAGESILSGSGLDDDKRNLLWGFSGGLPVGASQSLRLGYIRGDSFADVGMDSHSLLLTWSLRF